MEASPGQRPPVVRVPPALAALSALIVDDEAHVRAYLRLVLRSIGVTTVWEAANGKDGLEHYRQHLPDVVLLDVNLPLMSGEEVMLALTELDPGAAVVIVTSQNEHETVKRFIQLGAMGYVLKYLPQEKIVAALVETLGCLVEDEEQSA